MACDNLPAALVIRSRSGRRRMSSPYARNGIAKVLRGCGYDMREWVIENGAPSPGVREVTAGLIGEPRC